MKLQGGISGIGSRKPRITRSWVAAREKVDLEGMCRNCSTPYRLEAAHVIGRTHDGDPPVRDEDWSPFDVHPDRIIPLCGPATDSTTCHGKQHAGCLEMLPLLTREEQVQAVADVGSISRAMQLLSPSANPRRLRAA